VNFIYSRLKIRKITIMWAAINSAFYRNTPSCIIRCSAINSKSNLYFSNHISGLKFETLKVTIPEEYVYQVELSRPKKKNAMNLVMWKELKDCFVEISDDKKCRSIILSGEGGIFTAGLDLKDMPKIFLHNQHEDTARKAWHLRKLVLTLQESITSIENCPKPVLAAISGPCIGAGVDLVSACDIRYCSEDAYFQIKEVDIGIAADVGTLQRLPSVIGNRSLVSELAFTARKVFAEEAFTVGLVSAKCQCHSSLQKAAIKTAKQIAMKSPIAVQGTKHNIIYSRDNSVQNSLKYIATWNMAMMQTDDIKLATAALLSETDEEPRFPDL